MSNAAAERVVTDLVAAGLVERHRAVEAERVVTRSLDEVAPAVPGTTRQQGSRAMLVEIAGYVGSALVLASVGLLLVQLWDDLPTALQVGVLALIAVLLGGAGVAVSRFGGGYAALAGGRDDTRRRLTSTLLTGGALAAALAVHRLASSAVGEGSSEVPPVLGGVTMLVLAASGYRYARSALGLLAIAGAVVQVLLSSSGELDALGLGLLLMAVAAGWLAVTELSRLFHERMLARSLGVALALVGAQTLVLGGGHDNLGYGATAGVAAAGFVLYLRTAAWPYLVAGVLGITLAVPEAVMGWTDSSLGPAGGVLVAGLTLLAASLAGLRIRREVAEQDDDARPEQAPARR